MATKTHQNLMIWAVLVVLTVGGPVFGQSVHLKFDDTGDSLPCEFLGEQKVIVGGTPVWVQGQIGTALQFNGKGDYLEIKAVAGLTCEQTKALWICIDKLLPGHETYLIDEGGNNNWIELTDFGASGMARVRAGFDGENYIDSNTKIKPGYWYHIAVVSRASGELTIFINGRHDTSTSGLSAKTQPKDIVIGTDSGSKTAFFAGIMDEVAIHDTALSAEQIHRLYDAGLLGRSYAAKPAEILARYIRDALLAKQQALASVDRALHRESLLQKAICHLEDTALREGSPNVACLIMVKRNTADAIRSLQESRDALMRSIKELQVMQVGLLEHFRRQGIDFDLTPSHETLAPPPVNSTEPSSGVLTTGVRQEDRARALRRQQ